MRLALSLRETGDAVKDPLPVPHVLNEIDGDDDSESVDTSVGLVERVAVSESRDEPLKDSVADVHSVGNDDAVGDIDESRLVLPLIDTHVVGDTDAPDDALTDASVDDDALAETDISDADAAGEGVPVSEPADEIDGDCVSLADAVGQFDDEVDGDSLPLLDVEGVKLSAAVIDGEMDALRLIRLDNVRERDVVKVVVGVIAGVVVGEARAVIEFVVDCVFVFVANGEGVADAVDIGVVELTPDTVNDAVADQHRVALEVSE